MLASIILSSFISLAPIPEGQRGDPGYQLVNAFPNLTFSSPLDITSPPGESSRLFVVEQYPGIVSVFENNAESSTKSTFIDLSDRIATSVEGGLLALAFDPAYASNGHFFVTYATSNASGVQHNVVSRFTVSDTDANQADIGSEIEILRLNCFRQNHTAHRLAFGPDAMLYVAVGDGGCCGDPDQNGQDLTTLQGSILRLDVRNASKAQPYAIPADNPFASNTQGFREEIYCYGLRNPWRFSFGPDGRLWIGDVGQDLLEEISWGFSGANLGWPIMEGAECYPPGTECSDAGLVTPLVDYPHGFAPGSGFSVTGGYVYQGFACHSLRGRYVYADYITGHVWAMGYDETGATSIETIIPFSGRNIASFGTDASGEMYACGHGDGVILRITCPGECPADLAEPSGTLDFTDVIAFLTAFGAGEPAADYAPPSGVYDFSDVLAFLTAFGSGCP